MKMCRKRGRTDLEDPFVHDNNSNIETPPLENSEQRSKHTPLKNHTLLHFATCIFSQEKKETTEFTSIKKFHFSSLSNS
jgi:hypothetical protein